MKRIPQLDGLRGLAIALVVAYHYAGNLENVAPRFLVFFAGLGWTGVDLFFVLSGFLIGGVLLDSRESPGYFRTFYRRRFLRILPLYFAFLGIVGALAPIPWAASLTFTQNIWMAAHRDFAWGAFNPTWSLAVEEQFYLGLPLLIYFVRGRRLVWTLASGIAIAPIARLALVILAPGLKIAPYVLLPCRMDALLLGVGVAYAIRQPGALAALRVRKRAIWTGIEALTVACAAFLFCPSPYARITAIVGYDAFDLLFAAVLVMSLIDDGLARALCARWLSALGAISFGVYLFHQLVFGLVFDALRGTSWATVEIAAIAATIILAKLSWEFFEKPFVTLGHKSGSHSHAKAGILRAVGQVQ